MTKGRRNQYNRPLSAGDLPKSKLKRRLCTACSKRHIHRTDETVRFKDGIANILCADRAREAIIIETKLINNMRKQGYVLKEKNITKGKKPVDTRYKLIQLAINRKLLTISEKLTLIDYYGLALLHRKLPA